MLIPLLIGLLAPAPEEGAGSRRFFTIEVVDEETGRGVPLVELRTVNGIRLYTDSNGVSAFEEPGLMDGRPVFFHVASHGYEFPADGFGSRGKALNVRPGGSARLAIRRVNIAERLYRVTGGGIYRDSVLVGRAVPTREPVLDARVFGSDSVLNAVYRGKIYWFWGDTNRPAYPLGNFHTPGATSRLPDDGGLDPARGVDLEYFAGPDGFARPTAEMPGPGPTWIGGLFVLDDPSRVAEKVRGHDRERMFAGYAKIRPPLETYERGLVEFDPASSRFEKVATYPLDAPNYPTGHAFLHTPGTGDTPYVYFATAVPLIRVRAVPEDLTHAGRFEAFTCLEPGRPADRPRVVRDDSGAPRWAWTAGAPAVTPAMQARLIKDGALRPDEAIVHLRDALTGKPVSPHNGSVFWNAYRKRWAMIVCEAGGTSYLGETWFAEADTPLGPWVYARKVVTHDRYSFYNPKQHPMFDVDGGRVIFFEGTYTNSFSGNDDMTPRYDYNQVMYRLDLADPRLHLPVPIYRLARGGLGPASRLGADDDRLRVAFFAHDRPAPGTVPIFEARRDDGRMSLDVAPAPGHPESAAPLFHALPVDAGRPPETSVPLHAVVRDDGAVVGYVAEDDPAPIAPDTRRAERPLCRVWRNPLRVALPRE